MKHHIFPLGENAVTIDFGNVIDEDINKKVNALFNWWKENNLSGVKDIIPAYSSLTLIYDTETIRNQSADSSAFEFIKQKLEDSLKRVNWGKSSSSRQIEIPVCYYSSLAPDLQSLADEKKLPVEEVIQLHTSRTYRVYMIGFLPGFAYMGKVDARISMPRKINPRILVHEGSVGIAGEQTGIYPMDSPGGWNIIGQTPLRMFDPQKDDLVFLRAGDSVKFFSITLKEFQQIKSKS